LQESFDRGSIERRMDGKSRRVQAAAARRHFFRHWVESSSWKCWFWRQSHARHRSRSQGADDPGRSSSDLKTPSAATGISRCFRGLSI